MAYVFTLRILRKTSSPKTGLNWTVIIINSASACVCVCAPFSSPLLPLLPHAYRAQLFSGYTLH